MIDLRSVVVTRLTPLHFVAVVDMLVSVPLVAGIVCHVPLVIVLVPVDLIVACVSFSCSCSCLC